MYHDTDLTLSNISMQIYDIFGRRNYNIRVYHIYLNNCVQVCTWKKYRSGMVVLKKIIITIFWYILVTFMSTIIVPGSLK